MASERNRPEPATIEPEFEAKQFMQRRRLLLSALAAAAAIEITGMLSNPAMARAQTKHTLLILNPGHFHAGLTLRSGDSRLADDVYVYAEQGADVDNFIRMVETFNNRTSAPTRWKLHVYRGADYLERLRTERRGDIVVDLYANYAQTRLVRVINYEFPSVDDTADDAAGDIAEDDASGDDESAVEEPAPAEG